MITFEYRIVVHEYDDIPGEFGFFRILTESFRYGDWFPQEIEKDMAAVRLITWFELLIDMCSFLKEYSYVAVMDVEADNIWLEFERLKDEVHLNIVKADIRHQDFFCFSRIPSHYARLSPNGASCSLVQLKNELITQATQYISDAKEKNQSFSCLAELGGEKEGFYHRLCCLEKRICCLGNEGAAH